MIGDFEIELIDKPKHVVALGVKIVTTKLGGFYSWLHLGRVVIYTALEVPTPMIYDTHYKRKLKFTFWIW